MHTPQEEVVEMEQPFQHDTRVSELSDRRSGWTVERVLLVMTFLASCFAFIFGIGVQWAETAAVKIDVAAVKANYLPQNVYAADQRRVSEALDRLTKSIDTMNDRQNRQDRDLSRTPVFSRR